MLCSQFGAYSNVPLLRVLTQLGSVRFYNPQALMDMQIVKHRERAKQLQLSEKKAKTFSPALDHFRLTRFGWEHRKAGSAGERRRKKNTKASILASRIGFVNPRDYRTLGLYFPHMRLRYRFAPTDSNMNMQSARSLLPVYIG